MFGRSQIERARWWAAVGAIALIGLVVRLAATRGGLWTDEAWSVVYADQARDPAGVFLRINHDNNHHLISLWLQLVGLGAPPWLARLPSVLAGAASVVVAAMLAGRKSAGAGLVAALLFALSPIMVTYGSEARGYALMVLAALVLLLLVVRAMDEGPGRATRWWLGLIALFGMLSQMTMAAPIALVTLWVYLEERAAKGAAEGLRATARLMAPALAMAVAVPGFVFVAAAATPTGMRIGGYVPFEWEGLRYGLGNVVNWSFGTTSAPAWIAVAGAGLLAALLALRPPRWLGPRARLYAILIAGVPLAVAVVHPANSHFARYYLCSVMALLLVAAESIAHLFTRNAPGRRAALALVAFIALLSLWQDVTLARVARGHPESIVALIRAQSPSGALVALETQRLEAVTALAARRAGYPLKLVSGCAPAAFVVSSEPRRLAAPQESLVRCGTVMKPIASGWGNDLTGDRWILYRPEGLAQRSGG